MKTLNLWAVILGLFITLPQVSMAQDLVEDSLKDITTVAALGAAGAVLGLSTLSFVDEPKDHLKNILVGGAIGIIAGVGYVTFRQATESKNVIKDRAALLNYKEMPTSERHKWHDVSLARSTAIPSYAKAAEVMPMTLTFSF